MTEIRTSVEDYVIAQSWENVGLENIKPVRTTTAQLETILGKFIKQAVDANKEELLDSYTTLVSHLVSYARSKGIDLENAAADIQDTNGGMETRAKWPFYRVVISEEGRDLVEKCTLRLKINLPIPEEPDVVTKSVGEILWYATAVADQYGLIDNCQKRFHQH